MQPGDLRESVEFLKDVGEPDWTGHTEPDWQVQFTAPARIRTLKGGETVIAGRLASTQAHVLTIRAQPAAFEVAPHWRCRNARTGLEHNIRAVTPDERGAWIDVLTETSGAVDEE